MGVLTGQFWGKSALLGAVSSIGLLASAAVAAQGPGPEPENKHFSVPAGPLDRALLAIGNAFAVDVIGPGALVAGKQAPSVSGAMNAEEALDRVLAETDLSATQRDTGEFVIAQATAAPAAGGADSADGSILDTIIVVGERLDRTLGDTTSSVTVIDREAAEREVDRHINQILRQAPNLVIEAISETPVVRGVQGGGPGGLASGGSAGTLPRLTTIIDGVPQVANIPNASFSDLYDVRQVEVARGPQTTLFGRNAIGGAIIVETNDPTFEPEAGVRLSTQFDDFSDNDYNVAGFVSGPLVKDTVAARVTVQYSDGEDPREVIGTPPGADSSFQTDYESLRIRGKLLGEFETGLGGLRLEGLVDYQDGTTPQTRNTIAGPDAGGGAFEDRTIVFAGPQRTFDNDAITGAFEGELQLTESISVESLTSFTQVNYESVEEQLFPSFFDSSEEFFAQDVIVKFGQNDARLSGLVGFALEERSQDVAVSGVPLNGAARTESTQLSGFADVRVDLTPQLELIAGGRVLSIDQQRTQSNVTLFPTPMGIVAIPGQTEFDDTETVFLPSVGAIWRLNENHSLRATYKEGFNAGGASVNFLTGEDFTFDSERLRAVEAGWRGALFGDLLSASLTGFFYSYDDQQFFLETIPGDRNTIIVTNVPDSQSYGLELEARARPHETVDLTLGLGLLETEIKDGPANNPTINGNDFGRDPSVTLNVGGVWRPVQWLALDAQLNYVSDYFPGFENTAGSEVGDFVLVDLGATLSYSHVDLRVFARNVGDEVAFTSRVGDFALLVEPRTVGISLTATTF